MALIANCHRAADGPTWQPEDFHPDTQQREREEPVIVASVEQLWLLFGLWDGNPATKHQEHRLRL
jgi:hypothetical protein